MYANPFEEESYRIETVSYLLDPGMKALQIELVYMVQHAGILHELLRFGFASWFRPVSIYSKQLVFIGASSLSVKAQLG